MAVLLGSEIASRKRSLKAGWGPISPTEPIVVVELAIDGSTYAEALGKISFEENWIYFEGENMSFSLGPDDFVRDWDESGFGIYSHVVLHLIPIFRRVKIRFHAISVTNKQLRSAFWDWAGSSSQAPGLSVLPPLERETVGLRFRTEGWMVSAVIGFVALEVSMFLLVFLHAPWEQSWMQFATITSIFAAVGIHRSWLVWRRKRAFRALRVLAAAFEALELPDSVGRTTRVLISEDERERPSPQS